MGATFKENVTDIRNSKVADISQRIKSIWRLIQLKLLTRTLHQKNWSMNTDLD